MPRGRYQAGVQCLNLLQHFLRLSALAFSWLMLLKPI
jgi:hypothetical protein